ncbi:MAG TPA: beta-N-acetylhexosaminidase [Verrucomicrobiae bacterium]|jgi:hexosaminidase
MKASISQVLVALFCLAATARAVEPAIIPVPQEMKLQDGVFTLRADTKILADGRDRETAMFLAEKLRHGTGLTLPIRSAVRPSTGGILLTTKNADQSFGKEGYELTVTPDSVIIRAATEAGLFYGAISLMQLLPPQALGSAASTGVAWEAPCVTIKDGPRFVWRGLMLDVSRHFYTPREVEQVLDAMALHKLNVLHWHLVDDQGWRIQIKKYPRLTEVGAWRKGINFGLNPKDTTSYGPDGRYGGFYTPTDIKEVVRYAAARHIMVVPEIEMPGHSSAALAAYPQYSCKGGPFNTDVSGGVFPGVYCVGNDETFDFLDNVLTEVFDLFPSKYVHVGGDEVPTKSWSECPKCQARKEAEHLNSDRQLESYFIQRIEKFVNAHGKTLVGWSEIREGGLAKNAVVMDWIGGAVEAASAGHDVVMTTQKYCYLDHYQSKDHVKEPKAIGGFLPLREVYSFDPIPHDLPAEFQSHILGPQGNLWAEYIPNIRHAEYMIFPREAALAEIGWSSKDSRNFDDFLRRLKIDEQRLDQMGVNYRHDPTNTGEK